VFLPPGRCIAAAVSVAMVMQDARPLIECRYTGSEVCKSKDENNDTAKYGHARAYVTAITADHD